MLINSLLLIRGVKQHRCLFDQASEDFGNRAVRMSAWMEVTKAAIGPQFDELSESARAKVCTNVQKRWRHLRDAYVKTSRQEKPYVFSQELSFLKGTRIGLLWSDRTHRKEQHAVTKQVPIADEPRPQAAAGHQITKEQPIVTSGGELPPDTFSARKGRKSNVTEFENMLLNLVKTNVERAPSPPDPDEMFFLSQMPHIKALSPADRLDFKMKFMELLKYYTTFYD
uniref:BESS domain-containing protein n=1 Tax=Lygus hesperus TaxID=30085 RepID=A0A146M773_LYGHE